MNKEKAGTSSFVSADAETRKKGPILKCSECGSNFTIDKQGSVGTSVKKMCCFVSYTQGNAELVR